MTYTKYLYRVNVREVHVQGVEVEAQSPEDAIARVREGEGNWDTGHFEYSHTLEPDTWDVTDAAGEPDPLSIKPTN